MAVSKPLIQQKAESVKTPAGHGGQGLGEESASSGAKQLNIPLNGWAGSAGNRQPKCNADEGWGLHKQMSDLNYTAGLLLCHVFSFT